MILLITTCCTRSTAHSEAGGCTHGASKVLPPRLQDILWVRGGGEGGAGGGGWERTAGCTPCTHVSPARLARASPRPKKRSLSCPETHYHPSNRVPDPTHHAGRRGGGSGELALWISRVPLAQFRSWSRQARGVPRPCKDNPLPSRAPPAPLKGAQRPHRGPPKLFI